jgi:site-specific DNA recombinase
MNTLKLATPKDEPVKRSIRYLRVSSKRQLDTDADIDPDGNSIDTQRKICQAKEKKLGLVNVDEYIEPGTSAQSIEKRPVFRKMLKRIIEQRDVDCVIIYMRSRAFRNFGDAVITERQLKKLGVEVISAKEDFGDGIWADAMKAIADVVNEVQVRQNGEDIKVKMLNKAKNGGTNGLAKLGYRNATKTVDGHKVNTIAVDEERSQYVRLAFELFATGDYTADSLQAKLTEAGLRMPSGKPVSVQTVQKLLRDRYYTGVVVYKGMEYQGRHEPLISEELFERVQRVIDAHSGTGTRSRTHFHYLKGLLYCDRCKQRFIVQRAIGRAGGEYFYYFCRGRQDGVCDHPYVPVEVMEQAVVQHYGVAVHLPEAFRTELRSEVDQAAHEQYGLSEELRDSLTSRLSALERKEDYYLDLAAEEGWPKDKLRAKIQAIRAERKDIARSLEQRA